MEDPKFPLIPEIDGRVRIFLYRGHIRITCMPIYCGFSTAYDLRGEFYDEFLDSSTQPIEIGRHILAALDAWEAIGSKDRLQALRDDKEIFDKYWNKALQISGAPDISSLMIHMKISECTRGNGYIFFNNGIRLANGDCSICPTNLSQAKKSIIKEASSLDDIGRTTLDSLNMMVEETLESIRAAQDKLT